ncbi:hypothetical protein GmHk_17G049224 [Glycine max]|nr:hypothetical protein GmHk_17G049224 [Glycine max]
MAQSNSSRLGFPALITTLCIARGVARGPSKASTTTPSFASSPAPVPLTSLPPPSVPAPVGTSTQSSDLMVSMLQSLHHGLCLVMQSIHDLAQHRPIISMEDFMEQVAWPGVQPSPLGRGEASATQEPQPQHQPDIAHEAMPEMTPRTSPVIAPVMEVSEDEKGIEDTDYAADLEVAQSTWDPWPTAAQEILQPAQDTPYSPQGEQTPARDD